MKEVINLSNRQQFRNWLKNNHDKEKECWVKVKIGRPIDNNHLWYIDAVEEAICFGWIDSQKKKIDDILIQRFSPRRKNSHWSELNKARYFKLESLGLITQSGRLAFENSKPFTITSEISNAKKR